MDVYFVTREFIPVQRNTGLCWSLMSAHGSSHHHISANLISNSHPGSRHFVTIFQVAPTGRRGSSCGREGESDKSFPKASHSFLIPAHCNFIIVWKRIYVISPAQFFPTRAGLEEQTVVSPGVPERLQGCSSKYGKIASGLSAPSGIQSGTGTESPTRGRSGLR
jgi:hypothetical protein